MQYNHCNHMSMEVYAHVKAALAVDKEPNELLVDANLVGVPVWAAFVEWIC